MSKKRSKLGSILYKSKLVDKDSLIKAIKKGQTENKRLGEVLVEQKLLSEDDIAAALAKQFGYEYVDIEGLEISENTKKLIPDELIRKHFIIPLGQKNGDIRVAISDPLDLIRQILAPKIDCTETNKLWIMLQRGRQPSRAIHLCGLGYPWLFLDRGRVKRNRDGRKADDPVDVASLDNLGKLGQRPPWINVFGKDVGMV